VEPKRPFERLPDMKSVPEARAPLSETSADDAFHDLYAAAYRRMVMLAFTTTRSVAVSEELVQDAFIALYRSWDKVEDPVAWLRRTVVNLSISWLRRHLRQSRADPVPLVQQDAAEAVALRSLLSVLRPRQRVAVTLRYYEGLSEQQIADVLGCRPGTVKSLLSRSMVKLQEELRHVQSL
jgi:RNA polymerase sigma factor (sigma-70 family)